MLHPMRSVMKKRGLLVALMASAQVFGPTPSPAAVSTGVATAHVSVEVRPYIAVSSPAVVTISLQAYQTGSPLLAQVHFAVRANVPEVELQVTCTDLYWAGNPTSAYRIPVAGPGAQITCEHGSQLAGGTGLLPWQPTPQPGLLPPGWTGAASETGIFTASPAATFSQNVTADVSWATADPALPTGEYLGFVKLIGMVRP